ncbi:hypothetical protein Tco_1530412 [Tanacetum coccineum]
MNPPIVGEQDSSSKVKVKMSLKRQLGMDAKDEVPGTCGTNIMGSLHAQEVLICKNPKWISKVILTWIPRAYKFSYLLYRQSRECLLAILRPVRMHFRKASPFGLVSMYRKNRDRHCAYRPVASIGGRSLEPAAIMLLCI